MAVHDNVGRTVEVECVETDPGVAQIDSLRPDEQITARRATAFYRDLDRRAALEAAELQRVDARLVVGDIPPLAFAAAARARVPSVALGNFTWDWIYADYPAFVELAPGGDRYRPPRVCAGDARACGSPARWVRGDVCGDRGYPVHRPALGARTT